MRERLFFTAAAIVAFATACSGDASGITPPKSGNPSQQQVNSLSSALTALLEYSYEAEGQLNSSRPPQSAHVLMADRVGYIGGILCPEGGRTGVIGTYQLSRTDEFIEVSDTLVDCGMRDGNAVVWTFNSDPALTSSIDIKVLDSIDFERTQTDVGRIEYTNGRLAGTCDVDVAIADHITSATAATRAMTIRIKTHGTICGRAVNSDTLLVYPWPD